METIKNTLSKAATELAQVTAQTGQAKVDLDDKRWGAGGGEGGEVAGREGEGSGKVEEVLTGGGQGRNCCDTVVQRTCASILSSLQPPACPFFRGAGSAWTLLASAMPSSSASWRPSSSSWTAMRPRSRNWTR